MADRIQFSCFYVAFFSLFHKNWSTAIVRKQGWKNQTKLLNTIKYLAQIHSGK